MITSAHIHNLFNKMVKDHDVLKFWKCRVIVFNKGNKDNYAYTTPSRNTISFNKRLLSRFNESNVINVLRHEIAHVYTYKAYYDNKEGHHGRTWYITAKKLGWTLEDELETHRQLAGPSYQKKFKSLKMFLKIFKTYYYLPPAVRNKYGVFKS